MGNLGLMWRCSLLVTLSLAVTSLSFAGGRDEALELLERYSATQAKLQRISVKYTARLDQDNRFLFSTPYASCKRTVHYEGWLRWDGVRARFQVSRWGNMPELREKEDAWYNSWLYDGSTCISYFYWLSFIPFG